MYHLRTSIPPIKENKNEREPNEAMIEESKEEPIAESKEDLIEESKEESMEESKEDIYTSNDTEYFVDTVNILNKLEEIEDNNRELQVCIFKTVVNGYSPYLLYLLEYDEERDSYIFPKQGSQEVDNDDTIIQKILSLYPFLADQPDETFGTVDDPLFKGLYEEEDKITFVYDTTTFKKDILEEDSNYIWATTYEILGSQLIFGKTVDKSVIDLFNSIYEKHDNSLDFHHLKNVETNEYMRTPYTLYLCKKNGDNYENIKHSDENTQILYPRVDHEILGRFFLFSSKLLKEGSQIENLEFQRFVVFIDIDPSISILYVDSEENENKMNHLYDGTLEKEYQIVTFIENGQQYWSVKSPELFEPI